MRLPTKKMHTNFQYSVHKIRRSIDNINTYLRNFYKANPIMTFSISMYLTHIKTNKKLKETKRFIAMKFPHIEVSFLTEESLIKNKQDINEKKRNCNI